MPRPSPAAAPRPSSSTVAPIAPLAPPAALAAALAALAVLAAPATAEPVGDPPRELATGATPPPPTDACPDPPVALAPRAVHRVLVSLPDDVAADEARRAAAVAALAAQVRAVVVDYGDGHGFPVAVLADDAQLAALRAQPQLDAVVTDGAEVATFTGTAFDTHGHPRVEPPAAAPAGWRLRAGAGDRVPYLLLPAAPLYVGPWTDGLDAALVARDLERGEDVNNAVIVAMTAADARAIARRPEVLWLGRVEPVDKLGLELLGVACPASRAVAARQAVAAAAARGPITVDVELFGADAPPPRLRRALRAAGATLVDAGPGSFTTVTGPAAILRVLATDPAVLSIHAHADVGPAAP